MTDFGKGTFIWQGATCPLRQAIDACIAMGIKHVILKIGDEAHAHSRTYPDMPAAAAAFRAAGIAVWVWHYIYGGYWVDGSGEYRETGVTPAREAAFALQQIKAIKPDMYVIDVEREWEQANPDKRAHRFMVALGKPECPVALSSFRFPSLHGTFPWWNFLYACNYHMPQVYWEAAGHKIGNRIKSGPVEELLECMTQLRQLYDIPIIPVGRAYTGDGYSPKVTEITDFLRAAKDYGCPGASFWSLDAMFTHDGGANWQTAIAGFEWGGIETPLPPKWAAAVDDYLRTLGYTGPGPNA